MFSVCGGFTGGVFMAAGGGGRNGGGVIVGMLGIGIWRDFGVGAGVFVAVGVGFGVWVGAGVSVAGLVGGKGICPFAGSGLELGGPSGRVGRFCWIFWPRPHAMARMASRAIAVIAISGRSPDFFLGRG